MGDRLFWLVLKIVLIFDIISDVLFKMIEIVIINRILK